MRDAPEPTLTAADLAQYLSAPGDMDRYAASDLLPVVYAELRALARSRLAAGRPGQTLQPTALVHEVYLRLVGQRDPGWHGRAHFFGAAAQAMRNILVEQARRKSRLKHGGGRQRVDLGGRGAEAHEPSFEPEIELGLDAEELLALDAALERLKARHPRPAAVVLFRYIAGLADELTAQLLGVSVRTVERDWSFARAWLHQALSPGPANAPGPPPTPHERDATT